MSTTSNVYIQVIEDVITKVREEFTNNAGPGEGVLTELQSVSLFIYIFRSVDYYYVFVD